MNLTDQNFMSPFQLGIRFEYVSIDSAILNFLAILGYAVLEELVEDRVSIFQNKMVVFD